MIVPLFSLANAGIVIDSAALRQIRLRSVGRRGRARLRQSRYGEAAVLISVIAAVTVLAFLARPILMVLTLLAGSVMVVLVGRRAERLLAVVAGLVASGGGRG